MLASDSQTRHLLARRPGAFPTSSSLELPICTVGTTTAQAMPSLGGELFPQERSVLAWLERSEVVSWAKKKATGAGGGVVEQEVQGHSREREQAPCTGCMPKGTGTDRSAEAG